MSARALRGGHTVPGYGIRVLRWQAVDTREDPDRARYEGDPANLLLDLAELIRKPEWHADAACREHSELSWFPARGEQLDAVRAICAGCLVRAECQSYALEQGSWLAGVWAGTSDRQRRQLRREADAA